MAGAHSCRACAATFPQSLGMMSGFINSAKSWRHDIHARQLGHTLSTSRQFGSRPLVKSCMFKVLTGCMGGNAGRN